MADFIPPKNEVPEPEETAKAIQQVSGEFPAYRPASGQPTGLGERPVYRAGSSCCAPVSPYAAPDPAHRR